MNFFTIFMEFSITLRVRTERNENFYFLSFSAFSNLFWLVMKPNWYFLIFLIFFYFLGISYYALRRDETEWEFLFSLFLGFLQPILACNEATMVFFNFFNFFFYFFGIFNYAPGRKGTKRQFLILSFSDVSNLFWQEMYSYWYFLIFRIFLLFFWHFLLRIG